METSAIALQEKVQNPTIRRKTDTYRVLGLTWLSTGTLSGEGHNNKQCTVQWDAYWQAEACNSKQTPRTTVEKCCVVARQCPSTYCCTHCCNAQETVVLSNGSSSIYSWFCPVWLPLVWEEALRSLRFTSDQDVKEAEHAWFAAKHFRRASESLCNDGPSALKSKGTMLKNYVDVCFLLYCNKCITTLSIIIDLPS